MYEIIENKIKQTNLKIGLIAATFIDVGFGLKFLENKNIKGYGLSISKTPQEQTELQVLNKSDLTAKVIQAINVLKTKQLDYVIIYCNSLSGAVDLNIIKKSISLPIVTPLDVYEKIALNYKTFSVFAANCQSLASIEQIIFNKNKNAKIIGFCNLNIVEDIESNIEPEKIIEKYSLINLLNLTIKNDVELVILGCTHFTYFYELLKDQLLIDVLEPSEKMLEIVYENINQESNKN